MTVKKSQGTALITGASAGIGLELAKVFAAGGYDLVLVARRKTKLQTLAREIRQGRGRTVTVLPADLAEPDAADRLYEQVEDQGLSIEVLVNNAGVSEVGAFAHMAPERMHQIVQLNVFALTALTRHFLPSMVERGSGRIVNVASVASFQPVPSLAVYAATKAYVLSLSESLSEELRGSGVTVTALCPGLTDTDMLHAADEVDPRILQSSAAIMMSPEQVAAIGYRACIGGQVVAVPGLLNQIGTSWVRYQPRWLVRAVGGVFGRNYLGR